VSNHVVDHESQVGTLHPMTENTHTSPDGTHPEGDSNLDRLFDVLGHSRRRRVLAALVELDHEGDDELDVAELGDDEDTGEFQVTLHHVHLPRLEEAGSIEWDRQTGTVRPGPRYDEAAALVEVLSEHRDELPGDWP